MDELNVLGGSAAFLPSSWQSSIVLGEKEVCAVPWLADTRLIYYRRDLLDKAGVDAMLKRLNLDPSLRAERLNVETMIALSEAVQSMPLI